MLSFARSKTLLKSASLILICSAAILSGCSKTEHIIQQPGTTMVTQERIRAKVIGPNKDGKLVPGKANIPAGAKFGIPVHEFQPDQEKPK
jgi:hypothetical protein